MNDLVAKIFLKGETAEITRIVFFQRDLKFRCRHCASLCCRLGGPPLTQKDIGLIKNAGYDPDGFLDSESVNRFRLPKRMQGMIKDRPDGSCIFLKMDEKRGMYECSIYEYRPVLCRLYPFHLERVDSRSFLLKVIPCCRGLNDPEGEPVNEEFILRHLREAIVDLLETPPSKASARSLRESTS